MANGGTGVTTSTGSGSNVLSTSPSFTTPVLGTPTSGTLTNCTGYTFANLATKPTSLAGYGITDAATSTHVHGNITNAGAIGSTSGLPIITTTSGVLTTGSFGTTAGTFCQGNDSRLSDTRANPNAVTFNNGGAGGASGSTYTGSAVLTVSYNTIGAPSTTGTGASGNWGINVTGSSASCTGNAATATSVTLASSSGTISSNVWAGGAGYAGYQYNGGNYRFGFSSTGGIVDVYADGNFYATDSSHLVLHAGNYTSYSPSLTGSGASGTWGINVTGNAATAYGLNVHTGRNNEANKVVRTDGNGYIQCGYINSSNGDEANNSSPTRVWGTNGSDSYLRSYLTSALSVGAAVNLSTNRTNWSSNGTISAVVGQLAWKNYSNNHTIFDASASTSPAGGAVNNTNSQVAWSSTYPTLMGWNGANTYGVRVDSARISDSTSGSSASCTGNAATSSNTSSISNATGGSYTWTAANNFQSNLGATSGSLSSPPLQVYSTGNNSAFMSFHKGGVYAVNFGLDSDNVLRIGGWSASANRWQLDMSGNVTAAGNVTAYSDIRLKDNIEVIKNALEKVTQLNGVTFTRNDQEDKTRRHAGVIAQEVEKVLPEVVSEDNEGIKNVAYGNMMGLLIEAIKELQAKVELLEAANTQLSMPLTPGKPN